MIETRCGKRLNILAILEVISKYILCITMQFVLSISVHTEKIISSINNDSNCLGTKLKKKLSYPHININIFHTF